MFGTHDFLRLLSEIFSPVDHKEMQNWRSLADSGKTMCSVKTSSFRPRQMLTLGATVRSVIASNKFLTSFNVMVTPVIWPCRPLTSFFFSSPRKQCVEPWVTPPAVSPTSSQPVTTTALSPSTCTGMRKASRRRRWARTPSGENGME